MTEITANSKAQLISILEDIDIRVPPRSKGRKTGHCERWSICRLLATLAKQDMIEYPIELEKRERPDFLLTTDNKQIGIEITEAINPEYAKAKTLPEAKEKGTIIDSSLFKWGTPMRTLNDLRSIVSRKKLTGSGWDGSRVEIEYADAILDIINAKTEKLHSEGFKKYTSNWLSIYCNMTLPALDIEEANELFMKKSRSYWSGDSFSTVFVEKGHSIISYSSSGSEVMELENLWNCG